MLVTTPGFSTAEQLTEVSGRGVGMDVVRTRIESLGGRLKIHSTPGQGTRIVLRLPLTVAVIQGFLVQAAGNLYAVPVSSVVRTVEVETDSLESEADRRWLRTGEGAEGDPARFIPIHIMHFVAFALLTWITRGAAGLLLGALLLNYMNAYVGALSREGASWLLPFLGWHPWAVVRVIGFLLAAILLSRASPPSRWKNQAWGWVFGLLAADILLKWLLAPVWRVTIREQLNW